MGNLHKKRRKNNRLTDLKVWITAAFCGFFCLTGVGLAQAAVDPGPKKPIVAAEKKAPSSEQVLGELLKTYFTYQRENRADPFATFIKKEAPKATIVGQEPVAAEEVFTGMQLFEPGQLRLVSVVFAEDRAFAMVQDSAGKGYIIEKGTKVGRKGIVEDIIPNVVVIKQWSMTFAGKKKYKNIEMVLRKEGE